jgi:hypothetical protein
MHLFNDIMMRLFLDGKWRDISAHVRAKDGITYSRGRQTENDTTPPQSCSLVLDNRPGKGNGDYTEHNPIGQWYGHLRRFTPAEIALRIVRDTCSSPVASSWGATDAHSQGAWQVLEWTNAGGSASDYNKSSGKATHLISAANDSRYSWLADCSQRDSNLAVTLSLGFSDVSGGVVGADFFMRGQGAITAYYAARVLIQTDESVEIDIVDINGTSLTLTGPVTVDGLTHSASQALRIRMQCEGQTVRAKIWDAAGAEPFDWAISFVDEGTDATTSMIRDAAGFVGIRSFVGAGNTNVPVTFAYDDIEISSMVTAGEVVSWPQSRDSTGREQTVGITIRGPRGRLAKAKTITRSALYQRLKGNALGGLVPAPDAYWPLEDGAQTVAETVQEASGGLSHLHFEVQPAPANTTVGKIRWAADTSRPGSAQSPAVTGGGALFATILPITSTTAWGFTFQARHNYSDGFLMSVATSALPGVIPIYLRIRITPSDTVLQVDLLTSGAVVTPMMTYDYGVKEQAEGWHTIGFMAAQNGSDVDYTLYVDGAARDTYKQNSSTLQGLAFVNLGTVDNAPGETAYGHLAVWGSQITSVDHAAIHEAALGNPGEVPAYRAKRVAEEYGYALDWIGTDSDGKPMGAQRVANVLELLNDAEQVDGGLLYEQRSRSAFQFRTLRSMSSRPSWLTLDVATGKHLTELTPVTDERELCNRFTARGSDGGEYVYSLDSGVLSTLPPNEGGVGVLDRSSTYNVESAADLPDLARHAVARGTIDQERYTAVVVDLHRSAVSGTAGLMSLLLDLDIGDQITLSGLGTYQIYDDRDVIVVGMSGRLDQLRHTKTLVTMPAELTRVWTLASAVTDALETCRLDSDHTTLAEDLTATETDVTVAIENGKEFWVNSVSHSNRFPFDVICGGERMTVTAGTSPSGQNQTWTVIRSVNGVVKTHNSGSKISLFKPNYLGL